MWLSRAPVGASLARSVVPTDPEGRLTLVAANASDLSLAVLRERRCMQQFYHLQVKSAR